MSTQVPTAPHSKTMAPMAEELREKIISEPDMILDDLDVMRALIAANEKSNGGNIVDLRGIAMDRLEDRLDRLEDTHRGVIAAAYENLAGTNQIHRAILRMMDPLDFETFLRDLGGEVADILRVDAVKLLLETKVENEDPVVRKLGDVLVTAEPEFINTYLTLGRNIPPRDVTLRQITPDTDIIYGDETGFIHSEACMKLNFGSGRLPGLLILGAEDPHMFKPTQGTDLLSFFAGVFEKTMRRWLA
ncbi:MULTISPECIES: DUF484 family protein [Pacificibacter]|uniref:DUF484 family protein n=1 Tax=Pacificibacter TaxID=1042323 RepID=UPI001C09F280|nr:MULTISPECIES: DUF484 family protein [Pacificibacter]MBU2934848.1 DUF484 family protein [Pacificibacter marinus]MDO6615822.1 DUF484 family protein [Pacificibacter sp. 1_MG-2023]